MDEFMRKISPNIGRLIQPGRQTDSQTCAKMMMLLFQLPYHCVLPHARWASKYRAVRCDSWWVCSRGSTWTVDNLNFKIVVGTRNKHMKRNFLSYLYLKLYFWNRFLWSVIEQYLPLPFVYFLGNKYDGPSFPWAENPLEIQLVNRYGMYEYDSSQ